MTTREDRTTPSISSRGPASDRALPIGRDKQKKQPSSLAAKEERSRTSLIDYPCSGKDGKEVLVNIQLPPVSSSQYFPPVGWAV